MSDKILNDNVVIVTHESHILSQYVKCLIVLFYLWSLLGEVRYNIRFGCENKLFFVLCGLIYNERFSHYLC